MVVIAFTLKILHCGDIAEIEAKNRLTWKEYQGTATREHRHVTLAAHDKVSIRTFVGITMYGCGVRS